MKIHNKLWSITLSIYLLFDSLEESLEVKGVAEQEELPFFHEDQQQAVQGQGWVPQEVGCQCIWSLLKDIRQNLI